MSQIKAVNRQHPKVDRAPGILDRLFGSKPPALRTGIDLERTREQQRYAARFTVCVEDILKDFDRQRLRHHIMAEARKSARAGEVVARKALAKHVNLHFAGSAKTRAGASFDARMAGDPKRILIILDTQSPPLALRRLINLETRL